MENKVLTVNIRETNEQARRRVYKSKQLDKKIDLIKKIGIGLVSASIAAGAIGHTIISGMVADAKNAKDAKEAIILAAESDEYLKSLRENPIMNQVVEQADIEELEKLNDAITTYKSLNGKQDMSFNENGEYLNACNIIADSRQLVIDNYHDVIRKKIAEAYGINDPVEIRQISAYYEEDFSGNVLGRMVEIHLPGGQVDKYNMGMLTDGKVDSKLVEQIKNADELVGKGVPKDGNQKETQRALDGIIDNYEESMKFYSNYKVQRTENGKLKVDEVKQSKEAQEQESTERDDR